MNTDELTNNAPKEPIIGELTAKDIDELATILVSLGKIVSQQSTAEKEAPVIGEVYIPPVEVRKSVNELITTGGLEITLTSGKSLDGHLRRKYNSSPWHEASLYPIIGVNKKVDVLKAKMHLTSDFFKHKLDLKLSKTENKLFEGDVRKKTNLFYFHNKSNLQYLFLATPEQSSLKDGYPKNFYEVRITQSSGN